MSIENIQESVVDENSNASKIKSIKLSKSIPYTKDAYDYIEEHRQWREEMMANRKQSEDLYRNDNLKKKTWRALKQIVAWKTKQLIEALPAKQRRDPVHVVEAIKNYLLKFEMSHDKNTYNTLLSCMLFMYMKRSYATFFKKLSLGAKEIKNMMKMAKTFKSMNKNKTSKVEWRFILYHPIFCLGKSLFYQEEEMRSAFFKKILGCAPRDNNDSTRTRMTIIDDYEYFRVKILHTLENSFDEFY